MCVVWVIDWLRLILCSREPTTFLLTFLTIRPSLMLNSSGFTFAVIRFYFAFTVFQLHTCILSCTAVHILWGGGWRYTNFVDWFDWLTGTQDPVFSCVRLPNFVTVKADRCERVSPPPVEQRPCNPQPCPPRWLPTSQTLPCFSTQIDAKNDDFILNNFFLFFVVMSFFVVGVFPPMKWSIFVWWDLKLYSITYSRYWDFPITCMRSEFCIWSRKADIVHKVEKE